MLYALVDGMLVEASQDGPRRGEAPCCGVECIAKTGERVAWHWAHVEAEDCDPWSEAEGPWHRDWKRRALEAGCQVEVPYRTGGRIVHRADIVTPSGVVVEIQYSGISADEIRDREHFYAASGGIAWVFAAGWLDHAYDLGDGVRRFPSRARHRTSFVRAPQYWHHETGLFAIDEVEWDREQETLTAWLEPATAEDVLATDDALRTAWSTLPHPAGKPCATCGARPSGTFHDGSPRYRCHLDSPALHRPHPNLEH